MESQRKAIEEAAVRGDEYFIAKDNRVYYIEYSLNDTVENTNAFVTNSYGVILANLSAMATAAVGATRSFLGGLGARALGYIPDGYAGQVFTNVGEEMLISF